jgi:hypothetical protein
MTRSSTAIEAIPWWLLVMALGGGCSDPYYDNFNNHPTRYCGDEVKNRDEDCDASDLGGASCGTLGYSGGDLVCSETCTYDTEACLGQVCGDGACVPGEDPPGCAADCSGEGITAGAAHTCAWKGAGAVWCWGVNLSAERGGPRRGSHVFRLNPSPGFDRVQFREVRNQPWRDRPLGGSGTPKRRQGSRGARLVPGTSATYRPFTLADTRGLEAFRG